MTSWTGRYRRTERTHDHGRAAVAVEFSQWEGFTNVLVNKAKASVSVAKPNTLALAQTARVAQLEERLATNLEVAGSNPATGTKFSPTHSANCLRGLTSGKPKAGLLRSTAILDSSPGESKVQNDVSQLPSGDGQGWILRQEPSSALEVSSVRQAVL